jgi:hypothetical protein
MGSLFKFLRWLFEKFAGAALIVVLAVAACGLWLFLKDNVDFDTLRKEAVRTINGDRAHVQEALADVNQRMDRLSAEIAAEQERARLADKIIAQIDELDSVWARWFGNREQQKANAEQRKKTVALRHALTEKITTLQREFTRLTWERDGLEIAAGKIDVQLKAAQAQQSKVMHYLERTLNQRIGRWPVVLPVKWWIVVALALYFVGPTVGKIGLYFAIAPLIARGRPVRLQREGAALPRVSGSQPATELVLRPGERLWVKEKFLQASDEGLRRKTRYLLDWRIPLTCAATGLIELVELRSEADGAPDRRLTLSQHGDPHSELAVVELPEGASIVLRPSFLAGVVVADGGRLKIRRRWQLFRWQAWVTLQFRFFEFAGPCRLVVAGSRGVRVEELGEREGAGPPARRTNQDATIGFTPGLDYRPARAETFWSYYRGMNPLFDDLFSGRGIFLCQQVAVDGDAKRARKFWSGIWSGAMKVFGM